MDDLLKRPLTAVEMAELLESCRRELAPADVALLRRALFELDRRRAEACLHRMADSK